jgi:hypothetical protein
MKVELKPIIDQLSELLELPEGLKVSVLVNDNDEIVGWTIVKVSEDGTISPITDKRFKSIKELEEGSSPEVFAYIKDLD